MRTIKRLAVVLMILVGGPISAAILGGLVMFGLWTVGVPESGAKIIGEVACWAVLLGRVLPNLMRACLEE